MSQLNAWDIQAILKKERRITLPWVQHTFQTTYSDAVWMLEQMELRGWVEPVGDGCHWQVNRKALCLRRLKKSECAALFEHLTVDCVAALDCLREAHGKPVTAKKVEAAVHGRTDTVEALRVLTDLKLVFFHKEYGFSTISSAESLALTTAVRSCLRRRISERYAPEEAVELFQKTLWGHLAKDGKNEPCDDDEDEDDE
jgi:hypothetical protein